MNDLIKFQKTVRSLFPVYGPYERRFFNDLKNNISEYTEHRTDVKFSDLEDEFGSPTNIISDYLSSVDTNYLSKQLSYTNYIRYTCICMIIIFFIALIIWNISNYKAYLDFYDALPAIEETTIQINN